MQGILPVRPQTQSRPELRGLEQAASVKRWTGGGLPPQAWGKLRRDPELWDPSGDTLVYFGHQRPQASFRVQSSVLRETGSSFFSTLLRQGSKQRVGDHFIVGLDSPPPSEAFNSPTTSPTPSRQVRSRASTCDSNPSFSRPYSTVPRTIKSLDVRSGQPTPPLSVPITTDDENPVLHEIYFPAPPDASKMDILRHHLTTRNVLALLLNKCIVGLNFYQALIDLHIRLQAYMPPDTDCASMIIDYLVSSRLNDLRNDPAAAAGLLAWSEEPAVHWYEGWREAFVHGVGMYAQLNALPEFRDVSLISRALLKRSYLELQLRIQDVEDRLSSFSFEDIWPSQSVYPPPARSSFDRFRKFLKQFYEKAYKGWAVRVAQENGTGWLNRGLVMRLQKDFGALYDYLVDRDVTWEESEGHQGQKHKIVSKLKRATFRADSDGLPMTEFFTGFDNRHKYLHIPHPYPLLPTSIPVQYDTKKSLFGGRMIRGLEKRTALAYSEASNIFVLGTDFTPNNLVEAFRRFEKMDQRGEIDPLDARKGRWILLYGVLQLLASISVDTPKLWFTDGVSYFLNPPLAGTPPWMSQPEMVFEEASQVGSYCWKVPHTWRTAHAIGWSGLRNHRQIVITSDGIGDGTGRGGSSSSDGRTAVLGKGHLAWGWVDDGGSGTANGAPREDDSPETVSIRSSAEVKSEEKVEKKGRDKDTAMPGYHSQALRDVGRSHYVAPEEW